LYPCRHDTAREGGNQADEPRGETHGDGFSKRI
jgi:hypothetical protein